MLLYRLNPISVMFLFSLCAGDFGEIIHVQLAIDRAVSFLSIALGWFADLFPKYFTHNFD